MKRFLSIILAVFILLTFIGCGSEQDNVNELQTPEGFSVGFGRTDITPEISVPLSGFGNTSMRMSNRILRKLYSTCVAITDETGQTILMLSIDLQSVGGAVLSARPVISQATGIPEENIYLCATHTHAGPDFSSSEPSIATYIAQLVPAICQSAYDALADRKSAQMFTGSVETEGLNFVKHYQYTQPDGAMAYFGDNFGDSVIDDSTKHTTEADHTMHLVKFQRQEGKDVILANWRAHPLLDGAANKLDVSADYVGAFREAMELSVDCHFAFYQGAAGNINSSSRIPQEVRTKDGAEYGALLTGYALDGIKNLTQVTDTTIRISQNKLTAEINHDTDMLAGGAAVVRSVWGATNDAAQTLEAGKPFGIRSPYQANAIINRSNMGITDTMEVSAASIGNQFALVSVPCELFDSLSHQVEAAADFPTVFTLGYTNGYYGYIPSSLGFEYTCYESDVCWFKPGIGETLRDTMIELLQQLAAETEAAQ